MNGATGSSHVAPGHGFADRIAAPVDWRRSGRAARIGGRSCTTASRPLRPSALTYAGARSGNRNRVRLPAGGKCRIRASSSHTGPLAAMPDGFRPGNLVATPDGGRRALSERNRGTRVEIERAGARPIRLGPPVRRGAAMSCRRGGWPAAGPTDGRPAVTGRLALHGSGRTAAPSRAVRAAADGDVSALAMLLKATCWPEPDDGGRLCWFMTRVRSRSGYASTTRRSRGGCPRC